MSETIFRTRLAPVRAEWFLAVSAATSLAFLLARGTLLGNLASPAWMAFIFLWLFAAYPLLIVQS